MKRIIKTCVKVVQLLFFIVLFSTDQNAVAQHPTPSPSPSPSNKFFHVESRTRNIPIFMTKRMFWFKDKNISLRTFISPPPIRMIFPTSPWKLFTLCRGWLTLLKNCWTTLAGTILCCFESTSRNIKHFTANFTYNVLTCFLHNFTSYNNYTINGMEMSR